MCEFKDRLAIYLRAYPELPRVCCRVGPLVLPIWLVITNRQYEEGLGHVNPGNIPIPRYEEHASHLRLCRIAYKCARVIYPLL